MKVGTDGVLLGSWTNCKNKRNILDIGTGTGLIALMLAQRSSAGITAIEIDNTAIKEANQNFKNSKWKDRIKGVHSPIQEFNPQSKFDLIVSNPPYFKSHSKYSIRQKSRHQAYLSHQEIIIAANVLLSKDGNLDLVLPKHEGEVFISSANERQLFLNRICYVYGNKNVECKRLLLSFSRHKKALKEEDLIIENQKRHDYTEDYKILTKDFYLNF